MLFNWHMKKKTAVTKLTIKVKQAAKTPFSLKRLMQEGKTRLGALPPMH